MIRPLKSEKPRLAGVKLPANFTLLHPSLPLHIFARRSKSHAIHGRSAPKRNIEGCLTFGFLEQKKCARVSAFNCRHVYREIFLLLFVHRGKWWVGWNFVEILLRSIPLLLRFFWAPPTPESVLLFRLSFFCARALDGKSGVARWNRNLGPQHLLPRHEHTRNAGLDKISPLRENPPI